MEGLTTVESSATAGGAKRATGVAVLFGGCSEEHDISVKSAVQLAGWLDDAGYEALYIGIACDGAWRRCDRPGPDWEKRAGNRVVVAPGRAHGGLFESVEDGRCGLRRLEVDVAFPMLHGRGGEDGSVQGLLTLAGMPFVGCDLQAGAVCTDKALAYAAAQAAGIEVPQHWVLVGGACGGMPGNGSAPGGGVSDDWAASLPYPVFVKPARSGSSFGVSKVAGPGQLAAAVELARAYDEKVLVECAVPGIEVGCAVMDGVLGGGVPDGADGLIVGAVDQISVQRGFFRIHQEAHPEQGSQNAEIRVPANLPPEQTELVTRTARAIYRALGCRGLSRVDMFLHPDGRVILNEVNSMPGLTSYSRFPRMMEAAGWSMPRVVDHLIAAALATAPAGPATAKR